MKTKIALTAAASAMSLMLSGGAFANNWDAERDIPEIKATISEYVNAVCDFDIDKINSLKSYDLMFAERKIKPAAEDCKERGGIDRIDVVLPPGSDIVYRSTGGAQTDTTVYFQDGSSEVVYLAFRWETPERMLIESESTW